MKWDFFLSHAGADIDFASELKSALERETIDGRAIRVWLDATDIPAGASIPKHIEEGLQESLRVGLLMTRNYFESNSGWTDAEWHAVLFQDPDNRARKMLTLLAGDCDVPFLLAHLHRIDLRDRAHLQRPVAQILAALRHEDVRKPAPRGALRIQSALPDDVDETLLSNIFAIDHGPSQFYTADIAPHLLNRNSPYLSKSTFEGRLNVQHDQTRLPPYHLDHQHLVTFADPEPTGSPFRAAIVPGSGRQLAIDSPTLTAATRRGVIALLNATMHEHLGRIDTLLYIPASDRVYYRPEDSGGPRSITWPAGRRTATRAVAKPTADSKTGEVRFWLHHSAGIRFLQLGPAYVLQIEPSYVLSSNGTDLLTGPRVGKTINRWMLRERNLQIFRHVMFWRWTLASAPAAIETGAAPLRIADAPLDFTLRVGISNDHADLRRGLDAADGDYDPVADMTDDDDGILAEETS